MNNHTYVCAGCGIKNFSSENVWAERVEFRKGDFARKDVSILRHWCDACQVKRAKDIQRELTGMDSLI